MKFVGNFHKDVVNEFVDNVENEDGAYTVSIPVTHQNSLSWVEMLQYGVVGVYKESHE